MSAYFNTKQPEIAALPLVEERVIDVEQKVIKQSHFLF